MECNDKIMLLSGCHTRRGLIRVGRECRLSSVIYSRWDLSHRVKWLPFIDKQHYTATCGNYRKMLFYSSFLSSHREKSGWIQIFSWWWLSTICHYHLFHSWRRSSDINNSDSMDWSAAVSLLILFHINFECSPSPPSSICLMSQLFSVLLWGCDERKLVKGYWVKNRQKMAPKHTAFHE